MRLIRTRGLLSTLIMKYKKNDRGEPITDRDFKRAAKELKRFESWYSIYRATAIILIILICCYAIVLIST